MFSKVLEYFRQICDIPHQSGNTQLISDYCVNFAVTHGLKYIRDQKNNVIIFKGGTAGYQTSPSVILQGHLDMVCVKEEDCEIDFSRDGLTVIEDEEYITAKGTSLGADDGIAVAYILAILDSDSIAHPPIEAVFTTDEETGMFGADFLDTSSLVGKMLINIDSEDEGTLLVSCAGGIRADSTFKTELIESTGTALEVSLSGLKGGHSGAQIHENRLNAIITLAKILEKIDGITLCNINGGSADNVIAGECKAVILAENEEEAKTKIQNAFSLVKEENKENEPDIALCICKTQSTASLTKEESMKILRALSGIKNAVVSMSQSIEGLVQTSLNLGVIKTLDHKIVLSHAIRSSVQKEKEELCLEIKEYIESYGASIDFHSDYPAWEYKENSRLREVFQETYKKLYQKEMNVCAIHAGLECGLFCGKIAGLDCVSLGPDMWDIHSVNEKLSKSSAQRVFTLLLEVLKELV